MRRVVFLLLALLAGCAAQSPRSDAPHSNSAAPRGVETGVIDGARYRIEVPDAWNGELVMSLRGYVPVGSPNAGDLPGTGVGARLAQRGYAVAASDYRAQGWSVAEALQDNERLRLHFVRRYGQPTRTWVMGYSMGGLLTLATIERHPQAYAGALALCGANAPAGELFNDVLLTTLVAIEHYFPGVFASGPLGLADLSAPIYASSERIEAALATDPTRAQRLADRLQIPREELADVVSFYYLILRELQQRSGGHPLDNRDTVYAGFGDDLAFNRGVRRYRADPNAAAYVQRNVGLAGQPPVPVILLSNSVDSIVPLHVSNRYLGLAREQGLADRVVGRWSPTTGHCRMTPDEVLNALDDLIRWVDTGTRPASGEQP